MLSRRNQKRVTQTPIIIQDSDQIKENFLNNFMKYFQLLKLRYGFYFCVLLIILIELKSKKPLSSHALFWNDSSYLITFNNDTFMYQDIINLQYPIKLTPVLFILHGQHSYDWRKVIPYFQKKFHRIIISDLTDVNNSKQAEMVEQLIMFLHIQHFHLLTHTNERTLELLLKSKLVSNIKSLCIVNGGFSPPPFLASPYFLNNFGSFSFGWYIFKYANLYRFHLSEEDLYEKFIVFLQSKTLQTGINTDTKLWYTFLTNVSIPLHLVYGSRDSSIKSYLSLHNLTKYSVTTLESMGHYPQLEDPKLFVHEYLKLIKKI